MGKFHLYKATNKTQYYFTLVADNSEVIATSEMYNSKAAAENGIAAVKKVAPTASTLDVSLFQ